MIVAELYIVGMPVNPTKTKSPLIVDADAMLTSTIAVQNFKPAARRHHQEIEACGTVKQVEFPLCAHGDIRRQRLYKPTRKESGRAFVGERLDHVVK